MCSLKYVKYVLLLVFSLDAGTAHCKAVVRVKSMANNAKSVMDTLKAKKALHSILRQKYELVQRDEAYENILQCLDIEDLTRKKLFNSKPIFELEFENGEFVLTTVVLDKTWKQHFEINQPAGYVTPDGRKVVSTFIQENNKLTEVQEGQKNLFIIREFFKDRMLETLIVDDSMSSRLFRPVRQQ